MRWRVGEGLAVGLSALLLSLVTYASPVVERTLWRWSRFDAIALGLVVAILGITFFILGRPAAGPIDRTHAPRGARASAYLIDLGWAVWGLGYLVGSAFEFPTRGRLLWLDLINSTVPGASFLELAGVALFLTAFSIVIWNRVTRRLRPLVGLGIIVLLAVVAGEGWARWEAMYHPRVTPLESTSLDRWRRLHVALNAEGFRDGPLAREKGEGVHRLMLIGDALAFGAGIADPKDRLSEQLASRLAVATGSPWESMNLGRVGSNTKDQIAILSAALPSAPDLVVLLYSFDDIEYFAPVRRRELLAQPAEQWQDRLNPLRTPYINSVLVQEIVLAIRARYPVLLGAGMLPDDPYADPTLLAPHLEDLKVFTQAAEEQGIMTLIVPMDIQVAADPARLARDQAFEAAARAVDLPIWGIDSAFVGRPLRQIAVDSVTLLPNEVAFRLAADAIVRRVLYLNGVGTPAADSIPGK